MCVARGKEGKRVSFTQAFYVNYTQMKSLWFFFFFFCERRPGNTASALSGTDWTERRHQRRQTPATTTTTTNGRKRSTYTHLHYAFVYCSVQIRGRREKLQVVYSLKIFSIKPYFFSPDAVFPGRISRSPCPPSPLVCFFSFSCQNDHARKQEVLMF